MRISGYLDKTERIADNKEEWRRLCGTVMALNGLQKLKNKIISTII